MIMASLDFMPFKETLHLPLKVWGSDALHKDSQGSSACSSGCEAGIQKPYGIEAAHIQ